MILVVFLIYEKLKGEESFFHPYIDMVEAETLAAYWPEDIIEKSDLQFFKWNLKDAKERSDDDWEKLKNFFEIYPDSFDPERVNKDLYLWALSFINSRCFGWELPSTMLVPFADNLNHKSGASLSHDIFEKNLHKSMNKIYLYKHNFDNEKADDANDEEASATDGVANDTDKAYVKKKSKLKVICQKLFTEDEMSELPAELIATWEESMQAPDQSKLYSRDLCKERFRFNSSKHSGTGEEQKFDLDEEQFGKQLWGIGYISSDYQEDRDDNEYFDDEDELFEELSIMQKIRFSNDLTAAEMEVV